MKLRPIHDRTEEFGIHINNFKKKLWKASKQKTQIGETDNVVKSDQKSVSNRSNDGKKCKFCGGIHKPTECPSYGQECCKCKKNYWANCCYTKKIHEASLYHQMILC